MKPKLLLLIPKLNDEGCRSCVHYNQKLLLMKKYFSWLQVCALGIILFNVAGCKKEGVAENMEFEKRIPEARPALPTDVYYLLKEGVTIDMVSKANPGEVVGTFNITGLQLNETILGIDFRPSTGQLYGLGSTSTIYIINSNSGNATQVGAGSFTPALSGKITGFDFNPTVDRIRVVTSAGQNLRLNPETGTVAVIDGFINGADGAKISAVAYSQNTAGTATTTLYDIDFAQGILYKQLPPNDGTLQVVGSLGMTVSEDGGFDIAPDGSALALFNVGDNSSLFSIDLTTGAATNVVTYNNTVYTGIAIPTNPVAYAIGNKNRFYIFNPYKLHVENKIMKTITGLQANDELIAIDFRPLNGQLFALGKNSTLYTINASSGAAVFVATLSTPLSGTFFGFDFNPTVDRIRIVSNTGQNLRVIPTSGVATVDGMLNPGSPAVNGAAYTNSFPGASSTVLYIIDGNDGMLYKQMPPNDGTLVQVGSLGINPKVQNGFDISGKTNVALAVLTVGNGTKLYSIDISSGAASKVGDFGTRVNGFTVGLGF